MFEADVVVIPENFDDEVIVTFKDFPAPQHIHSVYECKFGKYHKGQLRELLGLKRTIFISMPFNDASCENHFNFIKSVITEVNTDKKANIKIDPLRIDQYSNGSAYKIPDEILDKIAESGLLIADLTHKNANVYHEVGYLIGLYNLRKQKKINLIMICNTTITYFDQVGFKIKSHKILLFTDTNILKEPLKKEIQKFYFKTK